MHSKCHRKLAPWFDRESRNFFVLLVNYFSLYYLIRIVHKNIKRLLQEKN